MAGCVCSGQLLYSSFVIVSSDAESSSDTGDAAAAMAVGMRLQTFTHGQRDRLSAPREGASDEWYTPGTSCSPDVAAPIPAMHRTFNFLQVFAHCCSPSQ